LHFAIQTTEEIFQGPQIFIQRLLGLDIENKNRSPSYYMLTSPWHISGSSFLQLTHTYSCLSCTCGQFQGPKDRQDLGPLTGNKLKATPTDVKDKQSKQRYQNKHFEHANHLHKVSSRPVCYMNLL